MNGIGLNPEDALQETSLRNSTLETLSDDELVPVADFSRLYAAAVKQMQSLRRPIPWAAGIGSDAFELMCFSLISCKTLGEALQRAERFDHLLYPLLGYKMSLKTNSSEFELHYHVRTQSSEGAFAPERWNWAEHFDAVSHVSGLMVWFKFAAWLVGHSIELNSVSVSASYVSDAYEQGTQRVFGCPIQFEADASCLRGPIDVLDRRLVHGPESLQRFLENSVYELIAAGDEPRSTTAAIRSLITRDFNEGMPSFKEMAEYLHCSESSLRRRLQQEDTSYQDIKDQLRCEFAIDHLRNRDTRINELAELLGFAEPSSFVRSFRSWVGMTPSAYRENHASAELRPGLH
ncbi:MAG: helix-turn-helix domain-containing protein [Pseudomonadales bacterium]